MPNCPLRSRKMIDAAVATGDKAKVAAVVEIAKQTNPDDTAEIDALDAAFKAQLAESEAGRAGAQARGTSLGRGV